MGNRTSVTSLAGTENYTLDALNRLTNVTYPNGDVAGYTYDANGNRLTKTFNGTPTNYTYDNADQLTSDGTLTYTYDANGNTTAAGADTFAWDYANRMTGATVGGTATTYAYDGDDTRVRKTVGGTPTNYVWDREDGLPLMVDDGTNAYLQEDGALAQVNGAGTPEYLLGDALASRRGVTNLAGTLTGTADYDTFGAVRASTGTGSVFGYTGEQFDAETGYTYLRARYLNPALGRFTSADTIQPNAPGTQGFNLYAYVASNPTTWVDPSGHELQIPLMAPAFFAWLSNPGVYAAVTAWMTVTPGAGATLATTAGLIKEENRPAGIPAWGVAVGMGIIYCFLARPCQPIMQKIAERIGDITTTTTTTQQTPCVGIPPALPLTNERLGHIMEEHGFGQAKRMKAGGYDVFKSEFRWGKDQPFGPSIVRGIVLVGTLMAFGKWHPLPGAIPAHTCEAFATIPAIVYIGYDIWGDETSCLRILTRATPPYMVETAHPVEWFKCLS